MKGVRLASVILALAVMLPSVVMAAGSDDQEIRSLEKRVTELEQKQDSHNSLLDRLTVHGFFSAGVSRSNLGTDRCLDPPTCQDTAPVAFSDGTDREWSHQALTRGGLQITARATDRTQLVMQLYASGRQDFNARVEWAYFSHDLTPQLKIRGGRLVAPFYTHSQYLHVGYAYPWVVVPQEVYRTVPGETLEGFDLLWNVTTGPVSHSVNLLWGSTNLDGHLANQPARFRVNNIVGANLNSTWRNLTLRLAYSAGDTTVDSLPEPLATYNQALNGRLAFDHVYSYFGNVGFQYDDGRLFLAGERAELGITNWFPQRKAGYLSVGWHFGRWMPLVTWAQLNSTNRSDQFFPQLDSAFGPGTARAFQSRVHQREKSWTFGVRYDPHANVDVKAELSRYYDFSHAGLGTGGFFNGPVGDESPVWIGRFSVDLMF